MHRAAAKTRLWLCPLLILGLLPAQARRQKAPAPPPPAAPEPAKPVTSGTFRDAAGQSHPWRITQTHALEWDGAPYLPVGGSFTPHSWAEAQTDAGWDTDTQALQLLKKNGVTDLTLNAGVGGLTRVPAAAVQRLLDYLDANDFHYGLEIADFPKYPLVGYTIEPSVFRDPAPPAEGPVRFSRIGGLLDAVYLLVSSHAAETLDTGAAKITGDTAEVPVKDGGPGDILLLYPRRRFDAGTPESHLPDLWQGYDEYRDRLLSFFSHVKLGKGFRFFLDPLTDRIGMNGEVSNLVPTTDGFRLDFEAWLDGKYKHNLDLLNRRWGIEGHDMPDFHTAARCIPLWRQVKGVPAVYDPVKGASYAVFNKPVIKSAYWDDLQAFKVESTRGYMNAVADALKKAVADVPVVYKWSGYSPLFTNGDQEGGYDGLGMVAYGHGLDLSRGAGAYTYAQAEETPRTTWLIASDTAEAPPDEATTSGFTSKATLFNDWDDLKDIGARGFFADSLQRLPAVGGKGAGLVAVPDQLGWLGSYAATLQASARSLAAQQPPVLWYPQGVAGPEVGVRLLPGGVWWLPTYRPGQALTLGQGLLGYSLIQPSDGQPVSVVWSPHDAVSSARFDLGKDTAAVTTASGVPLAPDHKGVVWTVPVGAVPTLVRGVSALPLSLDAPADADREARRLLALARKQNVSIGLLDEDLYRAENETHDDEEDAGLRYAQLQQVVAALTRTLRPYAWVEAEGATDYTFSAVDPDPEASGGAYLSLDTDRDPPPDGAGGDGTYHATYVFIVNAPGDYALWMAGTPPNTPASSPFTWQVDDGAANPAREVPTAGAAYAGKFVWGDLGDLTLARGKHTLTLTVTGRRAADGRYALAVDAFCVTRVPFQPDGPRQPPIVIPPDVAADADKGKGKHKKR